MLSLLPLGVLAAVAAPAAVRQDPPVTELGTVEFPAGPARGTARFFLVGTEPWVDVSVRNDVDRPVLWSSVMNSDFSCGWIVEPISESGEQVPNEGGAICVNIVGGLSWVHEQRLLPGAVAEPWRVNPLHYLESGAPHVVPPLDRWAWWHPFNLPWDPRLKGDDGRVTRSLVLAWSRATGPRVFLDRAGEIHFAHFDPFAAEPFQRGPGPIPFRCGPLRGAATMKQEDGWPFVEWTLTNPLAQTVQWLQPEDEAPRSWGFEVVEFRADGEADAVHRYGPDVHQTDREARLRRCTPFAPGETRSGRIAPFSYDPDPSDAWQLTHGFENLRRWHFVLESSWPCLTGESARPHFLPARLHLYWDAEFGFDAGLESPERFRWGGKWRPYEFTHPGYVISASFRMGACDATLLLRSWNGSCELRVHNGGNRTQYWLPSEANCLIWLQKPGASAPAPPPAQEPAPWAPGKAWSSEGMADRIRLDAGEWRGDSIELEDRAAWSWRDQPTDFTPPWELLLPVALPQERAPAHDLDARRGWLRIRWDPDRGLEASASETWPF